MGRDPLIQGGTFQYVFPDPNVGVRVLPPPDPPLWSMEREGCAHQYRVYPVKE